MHSDPAEVRKTVRTYLMVGAALFLGTAITVAALATLQKIQKDANAKTKSALVVDSAGNENLRLSIRNCKDHQFLPPEGVNVYDLLRHDTLVLSKDAVKALELRCLSSKGDAQ